MWSSVLSKSFTLRSWVTFNPSCSDLGWREKIDWNFSFQTLWCLKKFYEGLQERFTLWILIGNYVKRLCFILIPVFCTDLNNYFNQSFSLWIQEFFNSSNDQGSLCSVSILKCSFLVLVKSPYFVWFFYKVT